jgi:hypothetical protein
LEVWIEADHGPVFLLDALLFPGGHALEFKEPDGAIRVHEFVVGEGELVVLRLED